jgi:hypothetical protein
MTAVEDELPPSNTESLGDETPTPVTQQEPAQTQPESEEETVFNPSEAEEDSNSYSSNPRQPTTVMLTVEIDGVTYKKRKQEVAFEDLRNGPFQARRPPIPFRQQTNCSLQTFRRQGTQTLRSYASIS